MNYEGFMVLHDKLKQGIQEYITNNNNRTEYSPSSVNQSYSFYIPNGEMSTEICLATALRYFAGGSYLDISISHGISKTDVYRSVWTVVPATNISTSLQFQFPTTSEECKSMAYDLHSGVKQDLIVVLVALMECYSGQRNLFRSTAKR